MSKESKLSISRCFLKNFNSLFQILYPLHHHVSAWTYADFVHDPVGVFEKHISQCCKFYNLWNLIIQGYTLYFTLSCNFSSWGTKYRESEVLRTTRQKFFNKGVGAVLQLICNVTQIIPCFDFWRVVIFLNKDDHVCVTILNRLLQLTQILV